MKERIENILGISRKIPRAFYSQFYIEEIPNLENSLLIDL
jgi:hypothetical protein